MNEIEHLRNEIRIIQERNIRVEADKAWETSWTRRILIAVLTYVVVVLFFYFARLPKPFLNALVPSLAFLLSTLSISLVKTWWIRKRNK